MGAYERIVKNGAKWLGFIINRILRLYPALIISFLLISLFDILVLKLDVFRLEYVKHIVGYLSGINGAGYLGKGISNGVLWTMPVDVY